MQASLFRHGSRVVHDARSMREMKKIARVSGGHESSEKNVCDEEMGDMGDCEIEPERRTKAYYPSFFRPRNVLPSVRFGLWRPPAGVPRAEPERRATKKLRTVICRRFSHRLEGLVVGRCFLFAPSVFLSCRPFQNTLVFIERGSDILYQQREWARAGQAGGGFRQYLWRLQGLPPVPPHR